MTLDEFVRVFSLGMYRNSKFILDNIGIEAHSKYLPSRKLVDSTRDQYLGVGKFGKWWMKYIFPRLFPQEYAARKARYSDALCTHKSAIIVHCLRQALAIAEELAFK